MLLTGVVVVAGLVLLARHGHAQHAVDEDPLAAFEPPNRGERIANGTILVPLPPGAGATVPACAKACLQVPGCVCFTYDEADAPARRCELSGYSMSLDRARAAPSSAWYVRRIARNDTRVRPRRAYKLQLPTSGVRLHHGIMRQSFDGEVDYLISHFQVEDVLFHFRDRGAKGGLGPAEANCVPNSAGARSFGWDGGLRGSIAGLFLMGAGGILRWEKHTQLKNLADLVVDGIAACAEPDGYIAAFPRNDTIVRENPNYVTAWLTHGLIEASIGGNAKALPLIRGHLNWFNNNTHIPLFLPAASGPSNKPNPDFSNATSWRDFYPNPVGNAFGGGSDRGPDPGGDLTFTAIINKTSGSESEVICSNRTRANGGIGCSNHHTLSLQYQGIIKHTRMALTDLGTQADVDIAVRFYEERWWLEELTARNLSAIWARHFDPHSYENTAFEAYVELYILTGEQRYMDAMFGAWEMSMEHFIHVGGAMAYNQNNPKPVGAPGSYSPGSYHLNEYGWWPPTGETCGSVMWAKFNQRMHRIFPEEEKYVTEVERSIYNVIIAAQGVFPNNSSRGAGIRYFAIMHGAKARAGVGGTCCEGQGSRAFGSLPEYLYSTSSDDEIDAPVQARSHGKILAAAAHAKNMTIWVNMWAASSIVVNVSGRLVNVTTVTDFPFGGAVNHTISIEGPPLERGSLRFRIRGPSWATEPYEVMLSAATAAEPTGVVKVAPASYSTAVTGAWNTGDILSYTLPIGLKLVKYPATGVAQIRDSSFSRQPSGQWFTPVGGCISPPMWPYEDGCVFYRDFFTGSAHFVPRGGAGGEEDCVPSTAALGLVTIPFAVAANLTRGDNFSCAVYMQKNPLVLAHSDGWSGGRIMPLDTRNITSEDACKAKCANSTECAGLTFVHRSKLLPADSLPGYRQGAYGPCVLYSEVDRQSFNKLPGCDNWVKEPKCPFGGGSGCFFYVSGGTRYPLNCSGANASYADGVCPKPMPCVGTGQNCEALDPCHAAASSPAFDLTGYRQGAAFNCSMLSNARNASRFAMLYGPLLLAATGPWDPLLNVVRLPPGLDTSNPTAWLQPTSGKPPGYFSIKHAPDYTYEPYMMLQGEQMTTFAVIPEEKTTGV